MTHNPPARVPWLKLTLSLSAVAAAGVSAYAVIDRLDPGTLRTLAGFVLALVAIVVVGALFIGQNLVQAYLIRRAVREDDLGDMQQMALFARLTQGSAGRVNISGLGAPQLPAALEMPVFEGAYRDTTVAQEIEVE